MLFRSMPSSHSAVVTSLATMVGKSEGLNSPMFGIATIFAFVVMYDAAGVRGRLHNRYYGKTMRNAVRKLRATTDKAEAVAMLSLIHI